MKVLFMGTPEFAIPSLARLVESNHQIIAVVTGVDRPRGRGQSLKETPVATAARKRQLPIMKPPSVRDERFIDEVRHKAPDAIVLVAYGQIIPKSLLETPRFGCINLHPSLLPKYRGAAPIHAPILAGDTVTGVTTMLMNEQLDAGDIILQRETDIEPGENVGRLHDRLASIGAELLVDTVDKLEKGVATFTPQRDDMATYAEKVAKTEIDWTRSTSSLVRTIRGLTPFPGAYTYLRGKRLNVIDVHEDDPSRGDSSSPSGTIVAVENGDVAVRTGDGTIRLIEVQPEGSRPMSAEAFVNGYAVEIGDILGRN